MPLADCLKDYKFIKEEDIKVLIDSIKDLTDKGMHLAEAEATVKNDFVNAETERLTTKLNALKEKLGLPKDEFTKHELPKFDHLRYQHEEDKANASAPLPRVVSTKEEVKKAMVDIFELPEDQATVVSEIYDRVAASWAARQTAESKFGEQFTKEDYYRTIAFKKSTEEELKNKKILNQLAGEKGIQFHTQLINGLTHAKKLENNGTSKQVIKSLTGFEKGQDGKWRYEIPDIKLTDGFDIKKVPVTGEEAKPINNFVTEDSDIFKYYPKLKNLKVRFINDTANKGLRGGYDVLAGLIRINKASVSDNAEVRKIFAHELQHAIQEIEGFERGTSPSATAKLALFRGKGYKSAADYQQDTHKSAELRKSLIVESDKLNPQDFYKKAKEVAEDIGLSKYTSDTIKSLKEAVDKGQSTQELYKIVENRKQFFDDKVDRKQALAFYQTAAGEWEARVVADRIDMTPEQRANSLATEAVDSRFGISPEDLNFLNGGGSSRVEDNILYQIVGKRAARSLGTYDKLSQAELLEGSGKTVEEIYKQTGWEKGVDGKWRTDLPTDNLKIKTIDTNKRNHTLEDIVDYPELFQAYPVLKELPVTLTTGVSRHGSFQLKSAGFKSISAERSENGGHDIFINRAKGEKELVVQGFKGDVRIKMELTAIQEQKKTGNTALITLSKESLNKDTIVHEIQHAVQFLEGFTLHSTGKGMSYELAAAEVESRNAGRRAHLSDAEKKGILISATESVPRHMQLNKNAFEIQKATNLNQGAKAAIEIGKNGVDIVHAITNPDVSSPVHELAHNWEKQLTNDERAHILNWAGHDQWSTATSERFARGFEKYLAEGEAPSPELKGIFEQFKAWLTDIYKGIVGSEIDIELNEPMKKIYAEMLGADYKEKIKAEVKAEPKVEAKAQPQASEVKTPLDTPVKETPEQYADRLAEMSEADKEDIDFHENSAGYNLYEARKLKTQEDSPKFKKISEDSAPLSFDYEYVANVEGELYGLVKEEDPDNPDSEHSFVWNYTKLSDPTQTHSTYISDNAELVAEIKHQRKTEPVKEVEAKSSAAPVAEPIQAPKAQEPVVEKPAAKKKPLSMDAEIDTEKFLAKYDDGEYGLRDAAEKAEKLLKKHGQGLFDNKPELHIELTTIVEKAKHLKAKNTAEASPEDGPVLEQPIEKPDTTSLGQGDKVTYAGKDYEITSVEQGKFGRYFQIGDHFVKEEDVTPLKSEAEKAEIEADTDPNVFKDLIEENVPEQVAGKKVMRKRTLDDGTVVEEEHWETRETMAQIDEKKGAHNLKVEQNRSSGEFLGKERADIDESLLTYTGLKTILDRMKSKFGLDYKIVGSDFADVDMSKSRGRFYKGKVYINHDHFTKDTAFHEYLHPFVEALKIQAREANVLREKYRELVAEKEALKAKNFTQRSPESRDRIAKLEIIEEKLADLKEQNVHEGTLDVDHLYDKLHKLLEEDPEGLLELRLAKRNYREASTEEQRDEALVAYIGAAMAKNVTSEGLKIKSKFWEAAQNLIAKFREWLGEVIWGKPASTIGRDVDANRDIDISKESVMTPSDFSRYGVSHGGTVKGEARIESRSNFTEHMTLKDFTDFMSFSDTKIELGSYMDKINLLNKFQKDVEEDTTSGDRTDEKEVLKRIEQRLKQLQQVDNKRLLSPQIGEEINYLKGILSNKDESESINNYIKQGVTALSYVNDEMKRISQVMTEGNLSQANVTELLQKMEVNKSLMAFYDDANSLLRRFGDDLPDEQYRAMEKVFETNRNKQNSVKSITADLVTEWLYPYQERANANSKNPIDKKAFRNLLYNADADVGRLTSLFGSVGSLRDPLAGISRKALDEIFHQSTNHEIQLGYEVTGLYKEFLDRTGLNNSRKDTSEYYKKNYLRKASVLEKVREDKDKNPVYEYVDRWAFHEEFHHDLLDKAKSEYIGSLGEEPDGTNEVAHKEWGDKILKWSLDNSQRRKTGRQLDKFEVDEKGKTTDKVIGKVDEYENVPSDKYKNHDFEQLKTDPFYQKLYDAYKKSNDSVEEGKLKFGIVPQRSKGKSAFSDLAWNKGLKENAKILKGALGDKLRGEEESVNLVTGDDGEMRQYGMTDRNVDGTLYQKIVHPYTRMLEEADLDLVLPESILYFDKSSSLYTNLKKAEPNITALRQIVQGGNQKLFNLTGRTASQTDWKGNKILNKYKDAQESKLNRMLVDFIDNNVYGNGEDVDSVNVLGFNLSLNKLGNNVGLLTALNNMAFNVGASVSNVLLGKMISFIESTGGRYFNKTDFANAERDYWREAGLMMNDRSSAKKSMNTQIAIHYDAIQGEYRDSFGKAIVGSKIERYANMDSVFFLTHAGEHMIQIQFMRAMLRGQKIKLTTGETISLNDAWVKNSDGVAEIRKDALWTKEQDDAFRQRLQSLNQEQNGNYSSFDKTEAQRKWYGKAVMIYHKYIYNGWRARWGDGRYDYQLGDNREGSYRAFFTKLGTDLKAHKLEGMKRMLTKEGWNEDEKYAWNKVMTEAGLFLGMTMLATAIGAAKDDEGVNWGQNTLYLRLLNLKSDITMNNMFGIQHIGKLITNPSANFATLQKYADFFQQLVHDPAQAYKRKTGIFNKGESMLKAKFIKAVPIARQYYNFMSPHELTNYYTLNGTR